jgi:hypothetical protein
MSVKAGDVNIAKHSCYIFLTNIVYMPVCAKYKLSFIVRVVPYQVKVKRYLALLTSLRPVYQRCEPEPEPQEQRLFV